MPLTADSMIGVFLQDSEGLGLTSFSCAEVGVLPGASAACGTVLLGQRGYRPPAVICMKRMCFAWLLEKEPCGSSVKVAFWAPWEQCVSQWHINNPPGISLWFSCGQLHCQCSSLLSPAVIVDPIWRCPSSPSAWNPVVPLQIVNEKLCKMQWLHFLINPLCYLEIAYWSFQASVLQIGMCLVSLQNWVVKFIFKL